MNILMILKNIWQKQNTILKPIHLESYNEFFRKRY